MTDTIDNPRVEKLTEPSRQWRNWYRATHDFYLWKSDRNISKGQDYPSIFVWPSKEVAEQKASDAARDTDKPIGRGWSLYLGAFPVEGTP